MTITELLEAYWVHGLVSVIVGSGLIQIAPVKWNPWTWLAKKIGNACNADLNDGIKSLSDKIDSVEQQLESHRAEQAEESAQQARYRILRFNDEIIDGKSHTQEHYDDILSDIDKYERYCASNPEFANNKAQMAIGNVKVTSMVAEGQT